MALALDKVFLECLQKLPAQVHQRVNNMSLKYMTNPAASGLNFEKLKTGKNLYSIRITDDYRAICLRAPGNKHPILLFAAKHDEAYRWADTRRCEVNPDTGAVQIYNLALKDAVDGQSDTMMGSDQSGMFADLKDRQLKRLGVPEPLIHVVRAVHKDDLPSLEQLEVNLPADAYDALLSYAIAAETYEEIVNRLEAPNDTVDTNDFDTALKRESSQAQFVVVENDFDLEEILNRPLEQWRIFLHPEQRKLVNRDFNGPVRVLGSAGTGKTVVAMHRAKHLAAKLIEEGRGKSPRTNHKVLFVTYVRALRLDIEENLRSLCTKEELSRIEVSTLDSWVVRYVKKAGFKGEPLFNRDTVDLWDNALANKPEDWDFSNDFLASELEQVVLERDAVTKERYIAVSRTGRDRRLSRRQRLQLWDFFASYLTSLRRADLKEVPMLYYEAIELLKKDTSAQFHAVIADEVQDFEPYKLKLLRALTPRRVNDLFMVGDGHQRIFLRQPVTMGQCDIDIRGRGKKLKINYRTTKQIRSFACRVLANEKYDDLDGELDTNAVTRSMTNGPEPQHRHYESESDHWQRLVDQVQQLISNGAEPKSICVAGRTQHTAREAVKHLGDHAIEAQVLLADKADSGDQKIVRCANAHRIKGLEFDYVFIVCCNDDTFPLRYITANKADQQDDYKLERSLLYVVASRAKKGLQVLSYNQPSPLLQENTQ